jgi:hypothetical protein
MDMARVSQLPVLNSSHQNANLVAPENGIEAQSVVPTQRDLPLAIPASSEHVPSL